jgi:hypothetical protein
LLAPKAPDAASKGQDMLNDFAAATACRKFRYLPLNHIPLEVGDSGPVPVFDPLPPTIWSTFIPAISQYRMW